MCLPRLSLVEKYDDDASYTNSRPVVRRPSAVRGSVYLPRSSLRSLRSLRHGYSQGSASEALVFDHETDQWRHRPGYHLGQGSRSNSKTIIIDNSRAKKSNSGTTAVEISGDRNGVTTTVLSTNSKQSNHDLKRSVSWNELKYEKTISDSESDSSSDTGSTSSGSSSDSDSRHHSRRGRPHRRGSSRGGSRSRSHNRSGSRSRSRSGSRGSDRRQRDMYIPPYPHPGSEYPLYHQQRSMGMPTSMTVPVQTMQAYPQSMGSLVQPHRHTGPYIGPQLQPMVMQPAPHILTHDPVHGQYYQGPGTMPVIPHQMAPLQMVGPHLLEDPEEDQG
ncbi:hypothetical protein TWF730_000901 [Orbilia blumenaviensis]|uniref:Uncharacterized protein n=1 Tax=Orbilia blumenaviensis TaxID=1796055 RepID=A0AAV9VN16_9PEZI